MSSGHNQRRAYFAWAVVCIVWGTTYLGIRIALETIPPLLMAAMRWITAGSLMIAALTVRGERLPARREWPSLAILGVLLLGFGNGAVVWAEQTVASGLTAVLVATSPFWMVGIDACMPGGEAITLRRVLGLVVGFAGIVMLVWPELRNAPAIVHRKPAISSGGSVSRAIRMPRYVVPHTRQTTVHARYALRVDTETTGRADGNGADNARR